MKKLFFASLFAVLLSGCSEGKLDDNLYDGTGGISAEVNGGLLKPQFALLYSHRTCQFDIEEGGVRTFTVGFSNSVSGAEMNINAKAINIPEGNLSGKTFPLKTGEGEGSFIFRDFNTRAISIVVVQRSPKPLAGVRFLHRPHFQNSFGYFGAVASKLLCLCGGIGRLFRVVLDRKSTWLRGSR